MRIWQDVDYGPIDRFWIRLLTTTGHNEPHVDISGSQALMLGKNRHVQIGCRHSVFMMTLSNVNIFRVTGPLCGEFTGHRWIPLTKASYAELWCFLRSAPEQTAEHAGDLRRHCAHHGFTVILLIYIQLHRHKQNIHVINRYNTRAMKVYQECRYSMARHLAYLLSNKWNQSVSSVNH